MHQMVLRRCVKEKRREIVAVVAKLYFTRDARK